MVDFCTFSNLPLLNHVFFLMFKWLSIKMENIRWLVMCSKCHLLFDIFLACTCLKYVSTVEESVVCGPSKLIEPQPPKDLLSFPCILLAFIFLFMLYLISYVQLTLSLWVLLVPQVAPFSYNI